MSQEGGSFRVVFLVDISPRKECASDEERISNALNLSALEILSHFAHKNGQAKDNVRWGYKFFNSLDEKSPRDRFNFREFDSKLFEVFETEVSGRLEPPWSGKENEGEKSAGKILPPAETLRTALSEITYEFNWDMPDISSPCKPVRPATRVGLRGKSGTPQLNTIMSTVSRNYVFVLSPCPVSSEDMGEFVGTGAELTVEQLRGAMLPPHVYRQMAEACRIRLYWVDVQSFMKKPRNKLQVADQIGVDLMAQVLEGLNGCVIPGNALLQLGRHVTSSIQSLLPIMSKSRETGAKDDASADIPDFPLTSCSVLEYYTARCWERQAMDGPLSAILCYGTEGEVLCSMELQPMFSQQSRIATGHPVLSQGPSKTSQSQHHSLQALSIEWSGGSSSQLTCSTTLHVGQGASQGQKSSVRVSQSTEGCRTDQLMMVRGTVGRDCLPLSCFHPTHAYTCVVPRETPGQMRQSGCTLEDLLLVLSREGLSLVVDFHDPSAHLPVTGVLQPLTSASATLTVVRSHMLLTLEKTLAFPKVSVEPSKTEQVDAFVKRCVSHFLKKKGQEKGEDQLVEDTALSSSSCELLEASATRFRLRTLEPWHKTAPNSGASSSFIQKLSSIPEDVSEEETGETELLELLHKLYTNQLIRGAKSQEKGKDVSGKEDKPPELSSLVSRRSKRLLARIPSFSNSVSARAQQIMGLSYQKHEEQKTKPREEEGTESQLDKEKHRILEERREVMRSVTVPTDFADEDSLIAQLKENYSQWLEEDKPLLQFVQSSVQVALHYVKSQGSNDPEKHTRQLLEDKFLSKPKVIRDKYKHASGQAELQMKIREFQLQALLRMELFSALSDQQLVLNTSGESHTGRGNSTTSNMEGGEEDGDNTDDEDDLKLTEQEEETVGEICDLLRPISFAMEPGYLASLLEEQFVNNYVHNMERLLKGVYRELGMVLPELLAPAMDERQDLPNKPSVGPLTSVTSAADSASSVSSQRGSRRFVRNPSLIDAGQKKAILVPVAKADKAKKSKRKRRKSGSARKKRPDPVVVKEEDVSEVKRVRRNLSMLMDGSQSPSKLSRRASMPAPTVPSPRKSPRRTSTMPKGATTPRGRHVLKDNKVEETPAKKQLSNALWQKQERARLRARTKSEVFVVGESPVKPLTAPGTEPLRRSPRKHVSSFRRRPSFYDPSKRSRYVVSAQRVAKKIRGCNTSPLKIDFTSPRRTPRKSPGKFLLSELLGTASKPSPKKQDISTTRQTPEPRRTPRKMGTSSKEPLVGSRTPEKSVKTPTKSGSGGQRTIKRPSTTTPTKRRGVPSTILHTPTKGQSPSALTLDTTPTGTPSKHQNVSRTPQKLVRNTTEETDSPSRNLRSMKTSPSLPCREEGLHFPEAGPDSRSDLLMTPSKRVRLELLSTGSSPTNQPPPASATPKKGILKSPWKTFPQNTSATSTHIPRPFTDVSSSPGDVVDAVNKSPAFSTRSKLPNTPPQGTSTSHFSTSPRDAKTRTPDSISKWPRKKKATDSSPVQSLSTPKSGTPSPRTKTLVGRMETNSALRRKSPRSMKLSRARGKLDVGEETEKSDFLDDIDLGKNVSVVGRITNTELEDRPSWSQPGTTECGKSKVPSTSTLSATGLLTLTQSPVLTNVSSHRKSTRSSSPQSSKVKNLRCSMRSRSKSPVSRSCSLQSQFDSKEQPTVRPTGSWSLLKDRKRKRSGTGGQCTDSVEQGGSSVEKDVWESTRKKSRTEFGSPEGGLKSRENRLSLSRKRKLWKEIKDRSDSQEDDMHISALSSTSLDLSSADEDVFYSLGSSAAQSGTEGTMGSEKGETNHGKGTSGKLECTPPTSKSKVKRKYPSTPLSAQGLLKLTQSPILTGKRYSASLSRPGTSRSVYSTSSRSEDSPPQSLQTLTHPHEGTNKLSQSLFGSPHRESFNKDSPTSPSPSTGHYLLSSSPPTQPGATDSSAKKTSPFSWKTSFRSRKTPPKSQFPQRSPATSPTVSTSGQTPKMKASGSLTSPRHCTRTSPEVRKAAISPALWTSPRNKKKAGVKRNLGQMYKPEEKEGKNKLGRMKSIQSL